MIRKLIAVCAVLIATSAFAAPSIRGVVQHAGKPVAGATITPKPYGLPATTNARGEFVLTPDEWPRVLDVAQRGLGTRRIEVPVVHADTSLGTIELEKGAMLRVRMIRHAEAGTLDVRIGPRAGEHEEPQWLGVRRLQPKQSLATFSDLAARSYTVLVEGDEPLKRITRGVAIRAGETRTLDVEPTSGLAVAKFTLGGKPLPRAEIRLSKGWATTLTTDDNGEYRGIIWERGEFQVSAKTATMHTSFAGYLHIPEVSVPKFAFDVPDRRVRGRVVDNKGRPIADARVTLRTKTARYGMTRRANTDANGAFSYDGVQAGTQTIYVVPHGQLRPDPVRFELTENDKDKDVRIVAGDEYRREVTVVDHRGTPRAGATVMCASGTNMRAMATTDERGNASIGTPLEGESTLYVIPREGGLAIRRVRAAIDGDDHLRIVIAPATASLQVETLSTEGDPLREVGLLMRVNGELVPNDVARELHTHQGIQLVTDDRGIATLPKLTPGAYEFWPYRGENEAEAVLAAASAMAAPVSVNVKTGGNRVTVRFKKRR